MDEQLLKDFLETAKQNQYNWDVIMPKFPELEGVDLQLLKDYTETAIKYNYDYDIINPKFPELEGVGVKKKEDSISVTPEQNVELVSEDTSLGTPTSPINQPETLKGEENTILENVVGKNFLTDFVGDIYRAGKQGFVQGNTADESYDLMFKGSDASPQDIAEFIQSQQELASLGETDEMSSFNKIY